MSEPHIMPIHTIEDPLPRAPSPETHGSSVDGASGTKPPHVDDQLAQGLRFLSPAQAKDELGRLGGYRILRILGQGGMGMVLEAEDVNLNRRIALKVMRPEIAHRSSDRLRFIREARAAAAIEHLNIVPIYQVGEENDVPFIAMPFLKGEPLDARLQHSRLDVQEILTIGWQTALGLAAAHARGLIHRDIKPGNIWLEEVVNDSGEQAVASIRVRILDFGLARQAEEDVKLTGTGAVLGTPAYMAPEQAHCEAVDFRADLFSLGAVLYEMATGRRPFQGKTFAALVLSLSNDTPIEPSQLNAQLPQALSKVIVDLLAKDPTRRPASAKTIADSLRKLLQQQAGVAMVTPTRPVADTGPWQDIDATSSAKIIKDSVGKPLRSGAREADANIGDPCNPDSVGKALRSGAREDAAPIPRSSPVTNQRKKFPVFIAAAVLFAVALGGFAAYQLAFKSKSAPTSPESKHELVKNSPKQDPPKKTAIDPKKEDPPKNEDPKQVAKLDPKKDDPIVAKKIDPGPAPVVKGDEISFDLGKGVKLDVIKIAAKGKSFMMGSPKDEPERVSGSGEFDPEEQHEVSFGHDYYMGKYEVTQEQYQAIMGDNPSQFKGDKNPVEKVSWNDAQDFIKKLNEKFKDRKVKFRLPSEAEWEYACRAATTTPFHCGRTLMKNQANFGGQATKPVGSFEANAFGLFDMHGNVAEWCEDYYGPYSNAPKDGTAQTLKQSLGVRVLRGGVWLDGARSCRSAYRNVNSADSRGNGGGASFRLVVSPQD